MNRAVPDAFFVPDGARFAATGHTQWPWGPGYQHAGPPSALLARAIQQAVGRAEQRLELAAGRLEALSPLAVLARGYSITFHLPGRRVVTDAGQVRPGDHLETRVARGRIASTVTQTDRTGALDGAE